MCVLARLALAVHSRVGLSGMDATIAAASCVAKQDAESLLGGCGRARVLRRVLFRRVCRQLISVVILLQTDLCVCVCLCREPSNSTWLPAHPQD